MAISVRIHPLHANGSQRVEIGGRLDTHTYGELDDRLTLVLAAKVQSLLLDLAQLEYISSAGVRSVFRARKLLSERGGKLVIANAQPQVQKVFDIVKAVPLSEIFRSVEEADAYLDRVQKKIVAGDGDD
jgi:anti-anti-sigma factor